MNRKHSIIMWKGLIFTMLWMMSLGMYAQTITVKGNVKDDTGLEVIGATIIVEGNAAIGTTTDIEGNYVLNNVPASGNLMFTYVGMKTQKVSVNGRTTINVVMTSDTELLEEVVVVGFGTQKKVNLTGAVSTVDSKVFESRPVASVTQALQGAIPGMNFSYGGNGGELGNNLNINIRGAGTIGKDSKASPLVLIDGMEGSIDNLNPQDIESVSVLKDAASSAIYGSRAPFGVILITTKKGKAGQVVVNYNNNIRFTNAINRPETMDSYTFAKYFNRAAINNGEGVTYNDEVMKLILDYQAGKITDQTYANADGTTWNWIGNANNNWYDIMFGETHTSHEHNLSISGGTEKFQYYVSGNYMLQNGIISFAPDKLQRYTTTAKINAQVTDYLKANYSTKWIRNDLDKPTYLSMNDAQIYHDIAKRWPTEPLIDPNGHYRSFANAIMNSGRNIQQNDIFYQQLQLEFEFVKNWKIFAEMNYRTDNYLTHKTTLFTTDWTVQNTPANTSGTTSISESRARTNFFNPNVYTNYALNLDSGHSFLFLTGFQSELNKYNEVGVTRAGLISQEVQAIGAASGKDTGIYGNINDWATAGFFGRINYNFKERYLLEVSGRYDGTSRFAREKRWNFFPSFSLGWNIARESFWETIDSNKFVSNFKLRGSWGELGNQNTESLYPYIQTMPFTAGASNTNWNSWIINGAKQNISSIPALISRSLGWETVRLWNIGLDLSAFNNRLNLSAEYFVRNTLNMVGPAPALPNILGIAVPRTNNADLTSKGFELDLSWRDIIGSFSYGIKANLSDDRQKIDRYPNPTGSISTYLAGQYLGEIWGFETIGIAKTDAEMQEHLATTDQSQIGSKWEAGDIMYRDLNDDKKINTGSSTITDPGDLRIIGNNLPRYKFGLDLDAAWKGFDVRIFFQGVGKRDYWCAGNTFFGAAGGKWQSSGFVQHLDFFRPEGDPDGANLDAYFARPILSAGKNQYVQTRYLQNAAYIRLKNAQIGYTFPKKMMNKINLNNLRLFLSGENLFTITSLTSQFDPEVLGTGYSSTWASGVTKTYPLVRTLSVGMSINF
ncbi:MULTISPECIES: SusC/RagA family TonB-linked outer membrane protein [Proteiniphilum]|uniref:SusC/RagA family TonB-linked outer membrane protein n=1 Tax=Proteiniphilum TaxID=294702 RepID=UPI001EEB086F|nr:MULTISPECIES: TonB-dependent receptor [Proteiniphilum]ULB35028.1 TonB-dependent receptor [Proteiniphilum propionicum]